MAGYETDPPTNHMKPFGHRVDLNPHVTPPWDGQEAKWVPIVAEHDMRAAVSNERERTKRAVR